LIITLIKEPESSMFIIKYGMRNFLKKSLLIYKEEYLINFF